MERGRDGGERGSVERVGVCGGLMDGSFVADGCRE